jgi:ribosomal protein L1
MLQRAEFYNNIVKKNNVVSLDTIEKLINEAVDRSEVGIRIIGKLSFEDQKILENLGFLVQTIHTLGNVDLSFRIVWG